MDATTGSALNADVHSNTPARNPFVTANGHAGDHQVGEVEAVPVVERAAVEAEPVVGESPAALTPARPAKTHRSSWWKPTPASEANESPAAPKTAAPDRPIERRSRPKRGALREVAKVRTSLLLPRPDVFTRPPKIRGVHTARIGDHSPTSGWFLLAAHGGAGNGLLQRLSERVAASDDSQEQPGSFHTVAWDAGQLWPDPALEGTGAVVVVTRTTVTGLVKARDLAAQYLAGAAPMSTALLGVVVVADQPGKPPAPVAKSIALLDGVFARTWRVPYVPEYRLIGPDESPPLHPLIADVLADIHGTLADESPITKGPSQ